MRRFSLQSLDRNCTYHINLSEVFVENSLANIAAVWSCVLQIQAYFQAAESLYPASGKTAFSPFEASPLAFPVALAVCAVYQPVVC